MTGGAGSSTDYRVSVFAAGTALLAAASLMTTTVATSNDRHGKAVVCYVGTWATYRPGRGAFHVGNIDPSLCSHLVYSFAGLNKTTNTIRALDPYNDLEENYGKGTYNKMTSLKSSYPGLKVLLAIGGWNEGSAPYSEMAADPAKRASLIASVVQFLEKYNFDGFDLDWEFPTKRGGQPHDKANFVSLIKELRAALKPQGYMLTAAISASIETLKAGYDLPTIAKYLDLVHLMCYDYHGNWDPVTGSNAPLGPMSDPLTIEATVTYVLANNIPARKLVMGIPLYGRTFILDGKNQSDGKLGERAKVGVGFHGTFTRQDGFLGYNEICLEIRNENWTVHWDEKSSTPFATKDDRVVTYDDAKSIKLKTIYAMDLDLAGVLVWSVDTDDFQGDCSSPGDPQPTYPLLRAINSAMSQASVAPKNRRRPDPNAASSPGCSTLFVSLIFVLVFLFKS